MLSRDVLEAAEAIKRYEKTDTPDAMKDFNLDATGKKVHIDHSNLVNSLVKFICFVRMPDQSKEIMLMKLARPGLTNMQIAMQCGMRIVDVDLFEQEGKARVAQALSSTEIQDAISKFNTERHVEDAVKNIKHSDIVGGNKLD